MADTGVLRACRSCYDKDKTIKLAKKLIICPDHKPKSGKKGEEKKGAKEAGRSSQKGGEKESEKVKVDPPAEKNESCDDLVLDYKIRKKTPNAGGHAGDKSKAVDAPLVKFQKVEDENMRVTRGQRERLMQSQEQLSKSSAPKKVESSNSKKSQKVAQKDREKEKKLASSLSEQEKSEKDEEEGNQSAAKNQSPNPRYKKTRSSYLAEKAQTEQKKSRQDDESIEGEEEEEGELTDAKRSKLPASSSHKKKQQEGDDNEEEGEQDLSEREEDGEEDNAGQEEEKRSHKKKSTRHKSHQKKSRYQPQANLNRDKDIIKFSYKDLNIPAPSEFSYDGYKPVRRPARTCKQAPIRTHAPIHTHAH